jgi:dTDP-4-dehydrorhamnose 3,5-epimerase
MKFVPTDIALVYRVQVTPNVDERGLFARTFCAETFASHGLVSHFPQCNTSWNSHRGTLRGMHYQAAPKPEVKLVRCTQGRIYDVVVDLRPDSSTRGKWIGVELSSANREALYIPEGCAHGFLTLEDSSEVFYHMGDVYDPALARGVRWNDDAFNIAWPFAPIRISERDNQFPDYTP